MSLSASELALVVNELNGSLGGAFVQKAHAPLPRLCYLELRQRGRTVTLCLSAEPETARLSVAARRFPSPTEPLPFQRMIRQELVGTRLERIAQHEGQRVVRLECSRDGKRRHLVAELVGAHGNLFLTTDDGRVLAISAEPTGPRKGLRTGDLLEPLAASPSRVDAPIRLRPPYAESAEALFSEREVRRRAEEIRRRMLKPLKTQLERLQRTFARVRAEADRERAANEHRHLGELLAQNLHRLERGRSEVTLTDYTEAGPVERTVKLDAALSPKEQVERHFHQYRRLLRGSEHARRRLIELEAESSRLRQRIGEVERLTTEQLLDRHELLAPAKRPEGPPKALPYKEYRSTDGTRIWVGKGGDANDALTFRIARPHHFCFHVRGWPGAHVVVALEKSQALTPEVLLDAAHLAVHHSSAKSEALVEVAYTQVKFVRKMKDGGKGQVTFTREKTLRLFVEPERLERLSRSVG